jgi:hypothetical protein
MKRVARTVSAPVERQPLRAVMASRAATITRRATV